MELINYFCLPGLKNEILPGFSRKQVKIERIIEIIGDHFGVLNFNKTSSRKGRIVLARYILMFFVKETNPGITMSDIGSLFKKTKKNVKKKTFDHSDVVHGLSALSDMMATNEAVVDDINSIREKIKRSIW